MSPFFLVVVVSVFAGDSVAGEANWGTLRYLLLRPVRRPRLLASKLAVAGLMAVVATLVIVVTGLVAGTIAFGWHPVRAGFFEISAAQGSLRLALATGYVAWGLAGVVSFAFMLSTFTDVPAGAFGGAIGLAIASQIIDSFDSIGVIRNGLLTHYWQAWTQLFVPHGSTADMWRGALLQVPYALVFCSVAWWRFQRKDILS
jgi:ABC-2 type transport system permease protein